MLTAAPHHIIAIGASAGGMEEINAFFDHTPLDGVSYVIIQHLSADFKSRMVELLARHSKLKVKEAENEMEVKSNQVYLIPNDKYMTIREGRLLLTDKEKVKGPHLTINTFFNSLAEDTGEKAIGIVLSGLGSDGTEGIKAIKKAGGLVLVRNPETTEFGSMPSHAIATGLVDFVLEPELMPDAIEDYVNHEALLKADDENDERTLIDIINLIKERSPLDFTEYKQTTILRRTKRRAEQSNYKRLVDYLDFLKSNPEELDVLTKDFLISVTAFFRDEKAFDFIKENVLPDIIAKLIPGEELKMWVTGCATGEEVYSLAILIAEQLKGNQQNIIVKIFATDIDNAALLYAGKAVYNTSVTKSISPARIEQFFLKEGDSYRVKPEIRKMVIFAQHDLVKNPPYCNMHFISCRNLLIYMTPVLQKKIFAMLLFGLKMDGYLFLGSSENPLSIINSLEIVSKKWKIYKNIKQKRAITFDAFSMPELQNVQHAASLSSTGEILKNATLVMADHMLSSLAEETEHLSVCIDEQHNVLKSYGDPRKFLLQKYFTSNLIELLPKPLAVAFNTLSNKALKTKNKESVSGIRIKHNGLIIKVGLSVIPLPAKNGEPRLLMVTFSENKSIVPIQTSDDTVFDEKMFLDQYTMNLEDELKELKDKLYLSHEKLDASNENMQSFNEEMISANEEMQSTNEEMQSVNEELHTINADYQLKNKELVEINDDLNNYFRSNINGQLFINNHLELMKFSPGTVKQINLLETDIGRPLSNISTNIKFETIIDDIKRVLADGTIVSKEIETNNGSWYQMMIMPYVQQSNHKANGAIVTFNDITVLKTTQQELNVSNMILGMAIDSTDMGTWSIDVHTLEFVPSKQLKILFGYYPEEAMSYEAAIAQIVPEYRSLVTNAVKAAIDEGSKYDVEYPLHGLHDGKLRWVRGIGSIAFDRDDKPRYFTGLLLDITVHKLDELRKNDFIAMVSHELRTPLTSMQGYIQLLTSRAKKAEDHFAVGKLDKAQNQVKKMAAMINGFLNASSFEAGKIYLNEETFVMNLLIEEILEDTNLLNNNHHLLLSPGSSLSVYADRDKVGQVIQNFLSNAIKYSPKGGKIELSCQEINGMLQIGVHDEGLGIKLQDQAKLFDRYFRIESEDTSKIAGFGLGLYLSAEIIQRHNGKVWVESEVDKGSTFYFNLPLPEINNLVIND